MIAAKGTLNARFNMELVHTKKVMIVPTRVKVE
jgi:hypothetical protein